VLEPGSIVGGRYRVGAVIGRGGMGTVVEATHVELGTRVAIKILREGRADKPEFVERFRREARAVAQLRGEHVCHVHDFGTLDDGSPYMVMELLEGKDLGTVLDETGPLAPELIARYLVQACAGLAEAHAAGIIHRDLKPGNLVVVRRPDGTPSVKVVDFGIAKSLTSDKLTETESLVGSPSYMSPEQLKSSKTMDARSDVWALGVVMYELATGEMPFDGYHAHEVALAIVSQRPKPLPPTVPSRLADTIARCLRKKPDRRFRDVAALAEALEPLARVDPTGATSVARVLASGRSDGGTRETSLAMPSKLPARDTTIRGASGQIARSRVQRALRSRLAIGGALAIAAALAIVWLVLPSGGTPPAHDLVIPAPHVPAPAAPVVAAPVIDAGVPAITPSLPIDAAAPATPAPGATPPHTGPGKHPDHPHRPQPNPDIGRSRY